MPLPISLAHKLAKRLSEVRKGEVAPLSAPRRQDPGDASATRTARPVEIEKILISTQHADGIDAEALIKPRPARARAARRSCPATSTTRRSCVRNFLVNPTGRFVIGGPMGDCGLTGRKIIVDTYGGMARHGGGAFSGKDPSKVDRSAAYAARWVAKNIVAAGLADRAEVQVAYAIGVAHPVSVMVETFGTENEGLSARADRPGRRRGLRPAPGRVPRGAQTAPADLPEDRRLRPLRPRRPRLHVGAHRQGRGAARRRRSEPAGPARPRPAGGAHAWSAPGSRVAAMPAIAQVEPMTTARALRGPFDYRLPEELRERRRRRLDARRALRPPRGARRRRGPGRPQRGRRGEAARAAAGARARRARSSWSRWPSGSPREYCSTIARALGAGAAARRRAAPQRAPPPRASPARAISPVGARSPRAPELTRRPAGGARAAARGARGAAAPSERLLHGVTGSGKTEVYLRAAAAALEQGRGAIVLVPEIALTPQIVARFIERFGETVAVLHSRLRPAQRYAEWRRLREGEARVCVGPRSAVFAPIDDLGLIVVDEEHDASYKHEGDPRYDARDVAAERARALRRAAAARQRDAAAGERASATAALAPRRGGSTGGRCRACEVLDMRGETQRAAPASPRRRSPTCAARAARRSCCSTAAAGRTSSPAAPAGACGAVRTATSRSSCTGAGGYLACHHCGHREPAPTRCGDCASTSVARHGAGTERLAARARERARRRRLPGLPARRRRRRARERRRRERATAAPLRGRRARGC